MNNLLPKHKGIINEEQCKLYWMERGYSVSTPIGDNSAYDFILDYESNLLRIQCKKPTYHNNGVLYISMTTSTCNRNIIKNQRYPSNHIDYFAAYYMGVCYMIPFHTQRSDFVIRLEPPRNYSQVGINWAYQYEGDYVLGRRYHPEETSIRNDPTIERPKCANRQWYWITNGIVNKRVTHIEDIPKGYRLGRTL